jgi:6-phosphogluconolactonase
MASVKIFRNLDRLAAAAAERFVKVASEAIAAKGRFSVALSGGSTPRPVYALLASEAYAKRVHWASVHVFWGDERCVPPDHPQSNYRMAREALLDAVPIPQKNIHRIRGEDEPDSAATAYERELKTFFGTGHDGKTPATGFDLVFLGMGGDGHTASLFPGSPAVRETVRWVLAQYVEAASMWRITLTPVIINAARNITFLVSGSDKAPRLREVLEGPEQPELLPAQAIKPVQGRLLWLVDAAAAKKENRNITTKAAKSRKEK